MNTLRFSLLLLSCLLVIGCARSPQRHFYTLAEPTARTNQRVSPGSDVPTVVVGPVSVPALVDRQQIVTRTSTNELEISESNRWGESLANEIASALATDLAADLGEGALVGLKGQEAIASEADVRIAVDILRFESVVGGTASIEAAWVIRPKDSDKPLRGRSVVSEPCGDPSYDALVAAHTRALRRISHGIAATLRARQLEPAAHH
ncbi:MAG: membrane integrity-associated transporter subunit PqiC [Methylococcaceae bacterium]|jgi:uncharacterized lipoprotein YmbA